MKKVKKKTSDAPKSVSAKGKGNGKNSRGKGKKSKNTSTLEVESAEPVHVPRHLFDADNEDLEASKENEDTRDKEESELFEEPSEHFGPEIPKFTGQPGIKFDDTGFDQMAYVEQFLNEEFWNLLVTETNKQANLYLEQNPNLKRRSLPSQWEPVDTAEMKKFVATILLMGIVRKPRFRKKISLS